ncbi:hypothetical protein Tco_0778413, partial [Tanacetum coccineum]
YLAFGRHLEEIHVTWAHLEKKRTRLRPTPKSLEDYAIERGDDVASIKRVVMIYEATVSVHWRPRQNMDDLKEL